MQPTDARLALVRDHVANRHAARLWPGCPVCDSILDVTCSCGAWPHVAGCEYEWQNRAEAAVRDV